MREDAEVAPAAKSAWSTSKVSTLLAARSRNRPAPLMPPPMIRTSTVRRARRRSSTEARGGSCIRLGLEKFAGLHVERLPAREFRRSAFDLELFQSPSATIVDRDPEEEIDDPD